MMRRRRFILAVAAASAWPALAQKARVPRIGVLHPASVEESAVYPQLVQGLEQLGYVDGRTIVISKRSGQGRAEALPALVAQLLAEKPDVLVVVGPLAVRTAIAATASVPIVAIDLESEPVRAGWMKTLARPGGNVTGLFLDLAGMSGKWLQLLREAVPKARSVALLWDSASGDAQLEATLAAAAQFRMPATTIRIDNWSRFETALERAAPADAYVVLSSPVAFQSSAKFAAYTRERRLPAISPFKPFPEAGGLMSYGPDLELFFRRAPPMIERMLRGARAGDIAVEQPVKYDLVINRGAARTLNLELPRALLVRAEVV